jgi:hypothetical protein
VRAGGGVNFLRQDYAQLIIDGSHLFRRKNEINKNLLFIRASTAILLLAAFNPVQYSDDPRARTNSSSSLDIDTSSASRTANPSQVNEK